MSEYQKSYYILFNAITDALDLLRLGRVGEAKILLLTAHLDAEEAFVSFGLDENDKHESKIIELF